MKLHALAGLLLAAATIHGCGGGERIGGSSTPPTDESTTDGDERVGATTDMMEPVEAEPQDAAQGATGDDAPEAATDDVSGKPGETATRDPE